MTAVALPVTDAVASVVDEAAPAPAVPGFALWVGLEDSDAGRATLAALAQAVLALVSEMAPDARLHSALALQDRASKAALVSRLRDDLTGHAAAAGSISADSAAARARQGWRPGAPLVPLTGVRVVVDAPARELTVNGTPVLLTPKEFSLLEYLLRSPHRAVSRDELLASVWRSGAPPEGTRTIDVHVRRLREKLGGFPRIVTVRGVGYRCDPTPEVVLVGSGDAG